MKLKSLAALMFPLAVALVMTSTLRAQEPAEAAKWLTGYRYRVPVELENKSGAALPSTPVALRFDALAQMAYNKVRKNGGDLRVADANGTELPRIIEGLHDDSAPARIWVKRTPIPAGGKQTLYIYYGNPTATVPADAHGVVFSGAPPAVDNVKVNLTFDDLAPQITPIADTPLIAPRGVPGVHGRGAWFNGQNTGMVVNIPEPEELSKGFTLSMWYKPMVHRMVGPNYIVSIDDRLHVMEGAVRIADAGGLATLGYTPIYHEWNHLAVTYDGANFIVFLNGSEFGRQALKDPVSFPRGQMHLGHDPTVGPRFFSTQVLDDVVLTASARTAFPGAHVPPVQTLGAEETNDAVPALPDPKKIDVMLPIEAQSFEGVVGMSNYTTFETLQTADKPQWFRSKYAPYLSRGIGIFTTTPGATATKTIQVPKDGTYQLWVRYAPVGEYEYLQRPNTGSAFQIKAEQNGAAVGSHEYGKTLDYEMRTARWERATFNLKQGPAKLVLTKSNTDAPAAEKVDMLVLTNDQDYIPDHRNLGSIWLRFKIIEAKGEGPYRGRVDFLRHSEPWYQQFYLENSALTMNAGKTTEWIDGSKYVGGTYEGTMTLALINPHAVHAPQSKVQLDYARLPFESSIYKTVESESTRSHGFIVPGTHGDASVFETNSMPVVEASRRHYERALAAGWPKDNQPQNITTSATTSISEFDNQTIRNELGTLRLMGMNLTTSSHSAWGDKAATDIATKEMGFNRTALVLFLDYGWEHKLHVSPYDDKFWVPIQNHIDTLLKQLRDRSGEEELKRIQWVQLNDEMEEWLAPVGYGAQPATVAAFKKWLVEKKITPAFLGLNSFDNLVWVNNRDEAKTPEQKKLWMLEMDFASHTATMIYKRATAMVEKALGHKIYTTMQPSPHHFFFRGFATPAGSGLNYLRFWNEGGTTMPWCEDWSYDNGLLFATSEMMSFVAEVTRAGANHQGETGMYITSGGPDARLQKIYASLGRGARHINHYVYGPHYANTEGSWTHIPEVFNSVGFANADIARADDLLYPARQKKSPVAILWPWSGDVWMRNQSPVAEKFHQFLALVHEQTPVDIISEEQLIAGGLEGRKVLYVMDENLRSAGIQQIAKWVNAGGTLVATMGAGQRDEYDAESSSFDTLLGLNKRTLTIDAESVKTDFLRGGIYVKKEMGNITFAAPFPAVKMPAYGMKAVADVKSAKVLGTWEDGSPAATINTSGQGRAIFIGALPGLSYIHDSNMTSEGLTTQYPEVVRRVVNAPIGLAKVQKDVEVSTPIVEATLQEGDKGSVVTLVNYTMKDIASVSVTVRPAKTVKRVVSVTSGKEVPFTKTADGIALKMPLGLTDFLKLYY